MKIKPLIATLLLSIAPHISNAATLNDFMPPAQIRFLAVVDEYSAKYKSAPNELQKSTLWKERSAAAVKAVKPLKTEKYGKWIGVLEQMGTTSKGNAFIVVRVTQTTTLSTYNNELSDINEKTLIKNGSNDYKTLASLKTGQVIRFEYAIDSDGKGLTEHGKMVNPDFATRFSNIEVMPGASAGK